LLEFYYYFLLGVPPRYARGRRPVPSPRAQAVGTQSGKKSLQARFFAAASPAASARGLVAEDRPVSASERGTPKRKI